MARRARTTLPGYVHHIMHHSKEGQSVFEVSDDYRRYLDLLKGACEKYGLYVWAYCLVPDCVRLVVVPLHANSLTCAFREVHGTYAMSRKSDARYQGSIWKDRFSSCIVDDLLVFPVVRLVETLPVRYGLVKDPTSYTWSSAQVHSNITPSYLPSEGFPPKGYSTGWSEWLLQFTEDLRYEKSLNTFTRTGRPFGSRQFIENIENITGRTLQVQKRGRKPRNKESTKSLQG